MTSARVHVQPSKFKYLHMRTTQVDNQPEKLCTGNFKFIVSSIYTHAQNSNGSFQIRSRESPGKMLDMPNPYSIDLRWRIVWIYLTQNLSTAENASLVCVSERMVWPYIALFRRTGEVEPQQREYGPKKMLGDLEQLT